MTEEQAVAQEGVDTQEQQVEFNPFDSSSWVEAAPTDAPQGSTETAAQATAATAEEPKKEEVSAPDFSGFVKETFGFESVDEVKSVIDEYKTLKAAPKTEVEFQNEVTKNLYKALLEGKESEVYQFLSEKQKVERLASLEIKDAQTGLEILAAKLQNQYKDLTPDEVEYKLSKMYSIPEQPERGEYDTDEEYDAKLSKWQKEKSLVEKEIMIEAKLAKPEIEKLKGECRNNQE